MSKPYCLERSLPGLNTFLGILPHLFQVEKHIKALVHWLKTPFLPLLAGGVSLQSECTPDSCVPPGTVVGVENWLSSHRLAFNNPLQFPPPQCY